MKLQYLGTAASEGWPSPFCACPACAGTRALGGKNLRLRSGALVNDCVLLDFSPDVLAASQKLGLCYADVQNIVVTHAHPDHFCPSMLMQTGAVMRGQTLHVYGSAPVLHELDAFRASAQGRALDMVEFHTVRAGDAFTVQGVTYTALPAVHACRETLLYVLCQGDTRFLYGHDTGLLSQECLDMLRKMPPMTAVSLDATMGAPESQYPYHMTFAQVAFTREQMLSLGIANERTTFICNHFSHNGQLLHEDIERRMNPQGILAAYDGMVWEG